MANQEEGIPATNPPAPVQAPQAPQVPQVPQAPKGQQLVHLNWSYFKPEFQENLMKMQKAHLLCTNNWMNAHHFNECVKVVLHY